MNNNFGNNNSNNNIINSSNNNNNIVNDNINDKTNKTFKRIKDNYSNFNIRDKNEDYRKMLNI